ncbi:hypothetical protein E2C01_080331 [Portunus trituberculatus]|uniref:Uncharacterized protein n=1 Tax=Portunus trituberculatus TaxID=210409 RepID=A0A5B7ILX1_PORTR|nr:hypothetical protein [Portunus trituberculatus]
MKGVEAECVLEEGSPFDRKRRDADEVLTEESAEEEEEEKEEEEEEDEEEEEEEEEEVHVRSSLMERANQVVLKGFGHVERMGKERRMIREIYESQTATERLKGRVGRGKDLGQHWIAETL